MDAQAALPSLQHDLEAALASLTPQPRADDAAGADAICAAVEGLRQLQSIVFEERGGSSPAARDLEQLRSAFSPAATPQDDADVDQLNRAAANASASSAEQQQRLVSAGWDEEEEEDESAHGFNEDYDDGGDDGDDLMPADPLVAALLSDQCELCCAYVHDAICSSSSGSSPLSSLGGSSGEWGLGGASVWRADDAVMGAEEEKVE